MAGFSLWHHFCMNREGPGIMKPNESTYVSMQSHRRQTYISTCSWAGRDMQHFVSSWAHLYFPLVRVMAPRGCWKIHRATRTKLTDHSGTTHIYECFKSSVSGSVIASPTRLSFYLAFLFSVTRWETDAQHTGPYLKGLYGQIKKMKEWVSCLHISKKKNMESTIIWNQVNILIWFVLNVDLSCFALISDSIFVL